MLANTLKRHWYRALSAISDDVFLRAQYRRFLRKQLSLHEPKTFNEKIQWRKINVRTPLMTLTADKLKVRDYVAEKIGEQYLNELSWHGDAASDIPFDELPQSFVIKTNHASQTTILVRDKAALDKNLARRRLDEWMKYNYYLSGRQWAYKNIERKIIVEKFLTDDSGEIPTDYKFFVFSGQVRFIQVDMDRFGAHCRDFFDPDWNRLPFALEYPNSGRTCSKPRQLSLMLDLAMKLSEDFSFVRVDLYALDRPIFGELTHYPESGYGRFSPEEYDRITGDWLV